MVKLLMSILIPSYFQQWQRQVDNMHAINFFNYHVSAAGAWRWATYTLQYGDHISFLNLSSQLRIFRAKLQQELMTTRRWQVSLDQFFIIYILADIVLR